MIQVKNLTKKYGDHVAVSNLSFTVEQGQIYGFLGPNGAGKSTTMNIMTGYLAATEGDVVINGHNILDEPEEAKKCIGFLPEQPPVYGDMTVNEYLNYAAELKKIPKDEMEEAINKSVDIARISEVRNRLIKNLSKGFRQRVGMAQAVLGMPPVIILDEPTVGMDPKQIIEIRDTIRSLGKEHTVILSSHILAEVAAICDHIMIISHGKLVASDTPENLSRMLDEFNTLELRVKGTRNQIQPVLSGIKNIEEVTINPSEEAGAVDASIHAVKGADIREEIFEAMAKTNHPILEMYTQRISLEDIFLKLTSDDKNAVAAPKKKGKKKDKDAKKEDEEE